VGMDVMPWASLKYDTGLAGYRVNVTEDQLKGAPRFNRNTEWDWSDRSRDRTIDDFYGTTLGQLTSAFAGTGAGEAHNPSPQLRGR
jgi:hypothetical protein